MSTQVTLQRDSTLGPSMVAIQDWELERVLTLGQLQQYRERVELLEKKAESDNQLYDKQRLSLLRELKLKDSFAEKRTRDMEQEFLEQIQCMQLALEQEKQEHADETRELREHYERLLQTEQKKYERRMAGFQQRLNAKSSEYAQLVENNLRLQSPPQPRHRHSQQHHYHNMLPPSPTSLVSGPPSASSSSHGDSEDEATIRLLQERLISLHSAHEQEKREWQAKMDAQQTELQQLRAQLEKAAPANAYYLKGAQQVYEERLRTAEAKHEQKTRQISERYRGDLAAVKGRFLQESQQTAMQHEARVQNLVTEHQQTICELNEEHANAMDVLRIEHQAAMAERGREHADELARAVAACKNACRAEINDLQASMSSNALAVRKHWDARVTEAASAHRSELVRLQGELEVVKDRLAREIERCHAAQASSDKAVEEHTQCRKRATIAAAECRKLQRELARARKLARELVLIVDDSADVERAVLLDLLQKAISGVSNMHARQCILEQNVESPAPSILAGLSSALFF